MRTHDAFPSLFSLDSLAASSCCCQVHAHAHQFTEQLQATRKEERRCMSRTATETERGIHFLLTDAFASQNSPESTHSLSLQPPFYSRSVCLQTLRSPVDRACEHA